MPTELRLTDQKFFAQLNNGDNFDLNTSDFSRALKGGIVEKVRFEGTIQIGAWTELTNYRWQLIDSGARARLTMSGANFTDAFAAGDTALFFNYTFNNGSQCTVNAVTDDWIGLELGADVGFGKLLSNDANNKTYDNSWLTNTTVSYTHLTLPTKA